MEVIVKPLRLLEENTGVRVFGRSTYSIDNPEPHGYEFFLTFKLDIKPKEEIDIKELPVDYMLY